MLSFKYYSGFIYILKENIELGYEFINKLDTGLGLNEGHQF